MLLDYALLTAPTPLQAGSPATLTLVISNGSRQTVTVTNIVVTLPVGTNAKDLTAGTSFQSSTISGWNVAQSAGALTLTPTGNGVVTTNAVTVTIANVTVNEKPGTADISITETAAAGSGNPVTDNTSLPAAKFPVQFSLSDLVVTPAQVAYDGTASVMWTGTQADGATYTLDYPNAPTHPVNVSNVGPYAANNLTIFPAVFTLTVSLTVPGQDQPLIVQRQATVTQTPSVDITRFTSSRLTVGPGESFDLEWEVQLATSLTLALEQTPGTTADVMGLSGCTVLRQDKTLILTDAKGKQVGTLALQSPISSPLSLQLAAGDGHSFVTRTVDVGFLPPKILSFASSRSSVGGAETFDLSWEVQLADSLTLQMTSVPGSAIDVNGLSRCTISPQDNNLVVADATGKQLGIFAPTSLLLNLLFVLTASDGPLNKQASVQVDVRDPGIDQFSVDVQSLSYLVRWTTHDALLVRIEISGGNSNQSFARAITTQSTSGQWPYTSDSLPASSVTLTAIGYVGHTKMEGWQP
jgi:hypothetical protein